METMKKVPLSKEIKKVPLIIMIIMVLLSLTNLFGLSISGASIFLGVIFFFINKAREKLSAKDSGLDIRAIGTDLKGSKVWLWIALPLIMDVICIMISKLFLPEYIEYETMRAGAFVPIEISVLSIVQFFIFALGEEIAWRAFFQNQLGKILPIIPGLLITSLLFTLGHFKAGNALVVVYGLFFTFINSILYGVVFHKTKNAWVSTISHFISNIFSVILFILI